jgi:hypothetical protein
MEINKKKLIKELLEKDKTLDESDIDRILEAIEKIESFKRRKSTKIKLSNDIIMEISKKTSGFYPAYFFKWKDMSHYHALNPHKSMDY